MIVYLIVFLVIIIMITILHFLYRFAFSATVLLSIKALSRYTIKRTKTVKLQSKIFKLVASKSRGFVLFLCMFVAIEVSLYF